MTTSRPSSVEYDPYSADLIASPWATYREMRDREPLHYCEQHDVWALTRYADVETGLKDWQTFSSARGAILEFIKAGVTFPPGLVIFEDPPTHTTHRSLMARVFTPRKVAELEPQIRAFCARVLDPLVGTDRFDFVSDFAVELPMRVIGMLLGIPEQDQEFVRDKTYDTLRTEAGKPMEVTQESVIDVSQFVDYIDWRANNPSDDIMTDLLNAEFVDEKGVQRRLTREEVLTYVTVVAGAGNETTSRLIGWLGKVLAEHPDQRRKVVEDRSLLPNVIDETLRYEPTGLHVARYVTRDVEFHGTTVPAGSAMLLVVGAANRDERRFDDPETYDITRSEGAHLAFGFSNHFCLGASLARMEGRIALDEVLNRFPEWELDHEHLQPTTTSTVRGWEHLPVFVG